MDSSTPSTMALYSTCLNNKAIQGCFCVYYIMVVLSIESGMSLSSILNSLYTYVVDGRTNIGMGQPCLIVSHNIQGRHGFVSRFYLQCR